MQHSGGAQVTVAMLTERKNHFEERLSSLIAQWDEERERVKDDSKVLQLCNYKGGAAIIRNEGIVSRPEFG